MRVNIILFKEYAGAMSNDSAWAKQELEKLHSNIRIIRHPSTPRSPVSKLMFWSHHEKSVVIDQRIGYVGGLDLCYGRYDNDAYRLREPAEAGTLPSTATFFPGADYNNVRIADFDIGRNHEKCLVDKKSIPRMPWRDVQVRLEGEIIKDLSRSFIQYWSFIKTEFNIDKEAAAIGVSEVVHRPTETKQKQTLTRQESLPKPNPKFKSSMDKHLPNKKTDSSFVEDEDSEKRETQSIPRTFSKDDIIETRKDRRLFNSVQNTAKAEMESLIKQMKENTAEEDHTVSEYPALTRFQVLSSPNLKQDRNSLKKSDHALEKSHAISDNEQLSIKDRFRHLKNLGDQNEFAFRNIQHGFQASSLYSHTVQVCRSAGSWSLGLKSNKAENSIQIAYIETIDRAKSFIYIENQFFISSTAGETLKNCIAEALVLRIRRAIERGEHFVVFVVIPLLPGFEGAVEESKGTFTRIALGFQQLTITKGLQSIFKQ